MQLAIEYTPANPTSPGDDGEQCSSSSASPVPAEESVCAVCGYEIKDQFVLRVMSDSFHECCLRCVACNQNLSNNPTCFSKDGRLYCREDHSITSLLLDAR
ncbi:LIM domain protein [Ancylostoma duodenale]|uniref:LIM domain protein n=1 Tax=Ancylostoma duodenale TaxID=51022 RepID=A0A0C2H720_9BILA|nr:LIM domain protein [Ancylostoma duodenale]